MDGGYDKLQGGGEGLGGFMALLTCEQRMAAQPLAAHLLRHGNASTAGCDA